jgi:hypothetical protein
MATVTGRIEGIYAERGEESFRITLADRSPSVPAQNFWLFKNGLARPVDPHPPAPNYETVIALALWCASNGVRVQITTGWDLNKGDVGIDEFAAQF